MAALSQIRTDIGDYSYEQLISFLSGFRATRFTELTQPQQKTTLPKRTISVSAKPRFQLTPEEKALCQSLGISYKQLLKLREIQ